MMTNKFLIIAIVSYALCSCNVRSKDQVANNTNNANPLNKQVIITDPTTVKVIDSVFNFGTITAGEVVSHSFRFVNTGKKPLIVTDTRVQCGCTVAEKPLEPIQPGDTSEIKVKFDSNGKQGHTNKTVTIASNAEPIFPTMLITGEIEKKKD